MIEFSFAQRMNLPHRKSVYMYEVLKNGLEFAFGVAELRQSSPDHYLKFKPRKHSKDTLDKSQSILIMISKGETVGRIFASSGWRVRVEEIHKRLRNQVWANG